MSINLPKNTDRYHWTGHVKFKMQYYGLSAQKILGVIRSPKRKEEGIVKNTIAVMQPTKSEKPSEIWVMYQKKFKIKKSKLKTMEKFNNYKTNIISAWRYPGVSPKNNPVPEEILREIIDKKL